MTARVLLRAASGPAIGVGHVVRTRAVARALRELRARPVIEVDDAATARRLCADGLEARVAGSRADGGFDACWLDGFREWTHERAELAEAGTPCCVVENRSSVREGASLLVYPALHWEPDEWDREHADRVLGGAPWIPLSDEILCQGLREERDVDLLVTFGGSDPLGLTERVLQLLAPGRRVVCSLGTHMTERADELARLAASLGATLLEPGESLAPWMARSRAAVTALGTTLYELAYLGVPALVLANYALDTPALDWYARHGPHRPLGVASELDDEEIASALEQGVEALAGLGAIRVDGLGDGARRLAARLLERAA